MNRKRIIKELPGGLIFDSRVTRADLKRLNAEMREWDRKEIDVCGDNIERGWRGMKIRERRMAKVTTKAGEIIGVWESIPLWEEVGYGYTNWGWITSNAADAHALAYCKGAAETVRLWWELEDPDAEYALVESIEGHHQAERFLAEIMEANFLGVKELHGHNHCIWQFTRPKTKEAR